MRHSLLLFVIVFGTAITLGCSGDKTTTTATPEAEGETAEVDRSHPDYENLLGAWRIVESEWDGDANERAVGNFFTFSNTRLKAWIRGLGDLGLEYEIDPTKSPKHLTVRMGRPPNEGIYHAIYELDGNNLKICYRERERPTGFETERGSMWTSHVLKRTSPDD